MTESNWTEENNELVKTFTFKSYLKTMSFVNAVAWLANKHNHHPEMIVSFNQCVVKLKTHDEGKVTKKDLDLAGAIDSL